VINRKFGFLIKKGDSIYELGSEHFIAPIIHANWATLINHSGKPNVIAEIKSLNNRVGIFLKSSREICKGEELFLDYG
jgi:SET domain-containing protein